MYQTEVFYLLGIRHCSVHKADAVRDCNAYKHQQFIVDMRDVRDHPILSSFLTTLDDGSSLIRRSSGALETGWKPNYGYKTEEQFLKKCPERGWVIPMTNGTLIKCIPLSDFADSGSAIEVLDSGLYREDAERASHLIRVEEAMEVPGIGLAVCDGKVCRIFIGGQ
jgi:hypothetical protein